MSNERLLSNFQFPFLVYNVNGFFLQIYRCSHIVSRFTCFQSLEPPIVVFQRPFGRGLFLPFSVFFHFMITNIEVY